MLQVVVSISATEDKKIYLRIYEVNIQGKNILEEENDNKILI
jgi:hypothetical protein